MTENKSAKSTFANILSGLFVVLIFVGWNGYGIYSEYTWHKLITEKKAKDGWIVAGTQQIISCGSIYQFFWSVPNRLLFVKPENFKTKNQYIVAEVLDTSLTEGDQDEDTELRAFDCEKQKFSNRLSDISELDKTEWRESDGIFGDALKTVCSKKSK